MNRNQITLCAWLAVVGISGGCANTVRGAKQDTERATEKTAAAVQTVDVKSALIADGRVYANEYQRRYDRQHENRCPQGIGADRRAESNG